MKTYTPYGKVLKEARYTEDKFNELLAKFQGKFEGVTVFFNCQTFESFLHQDLIKTYGFDFKDPKKDHIRFADPKTNEIVFQEVEKYENIVN